MDKKCLYCDQIVISHSMIGHEPKICGKCAREKKICPWSLQKSEKSLLGYHCLDEDEYYAVGSIGYEDDGVIY